MRLKARILAVLGAALMMGTLITACDPPATAGPNKPCPAGWQRVSTQSWWQKANAYGTTAVPQSLPASGVGGHLHVELCFPTNLRFDGDTMNLSVQIKTHQKFTGQGSVLDVGNGFASGSTIKKIENIAWDSRCPSGMCSTTVNISVPTTGLNDGLNLFRVRYLPARHPNTERQFASNELPFYLNANPPSGSCPQATEGKGWYDSTPSGGSELEYARAGFNSCLPGNTAKSGIYEFNMRSTSTNEPITIAEAHIDARYGSDDFSGLIPGSQWTPPNVGSSNSRTVSLNTANYADGWHCLSVLTQSKDPETDGVNTGVQEVGILIDNPGGLDAATAAATDAGHGSCYDTMPAH